MKVESWKRKKKEKKLQKEVLLVKGIRPIEVPHKGKKAISNVSLTSKIKNKFNNIADLDQEIFGEKEGSFLTF